MTPAQRVMLAAGFARFQWFRRWVGGRWERRYAPHVPGIPCGRWCRRPATMMSDLTDGFRDVVEGLGLSSRMLGADVEVWPTPELRRAMPVARKVRG